MAAFFIEQLFMGPDSFFVEASSKTCFVADEPPPPPQVKPAETPIKDPRMKTKDTPEPWKNRPLV